MRAELALLRVSLVEVFSRIEHAKNPNKKPSVEGLPDDFNSPPESDTDAAKNDDNWMKDFFFPLSGRSEAEADDVIPSVPELAIRVLSLLCILKMYQLRGLVCSPQDLE